MFLVFKLKLMHVNNKCRVRQHLSINTILLHLPGSRKKKFVVTFACESNTLLFHACRKNNGFVNRHKGNFRIILFIVKFVLMYVLNCLEKQEYYRVLKKVILLTNYKITNYIH